MCIYKVQDRNAFFIYQIYLSSAEQEGEMCMIYVTAVGGVTADIELKESAKGSPYLSFDLAVTKGYGKNRHTIYLQVWAFGEMAERIVAAKVRKGSQLFISGDFDIVTFQRNDGSKGMANKVYLQDWEFVGGSGSKEKAEADQKPKPAYQEHHCEDEDDLP